MPHSSGGGSHSSGSHSHSSGGHHSSGGGSYNGGYTRESEPIVIFQPKQGGSKSGYSKYAFYNNKEIQYAYIKDKPERYKGSLWFIIFLSILFVPFLCISLGHIISNIKLIKPIDVNSYESSVNIEDNANLLTDTEEKDLLNAFAEFRNKTGIACELVTDYNETWMSNYNMLTNYAYDLYVNKWQDENHWLLIYTEPKTGISDDQGEFVDWFWEGMQGDNTDPILTGPVTDTFNKDLQHNLTNNSITVGEAFTDSISTLTKDIKVSGLSPSDGLFTGLAELVVISPFLIVILVMVNSVLATARAEKKEIEEKKADGIKVDEKTIEDTCEYCGGLYIHGIHTSCPHCGATLKPMNVN